jgi:hypothetical protein
MSKIFVNGVIVARFNNEKAEVGALNFLTMYGNTPNEAYVVQELDDWQVQELDSKTQEFSTKAQNYSTQWDEEAKKKMTEFHAAMFGVDASVIKEKNIFNFFGDV